MRSTASRLPPYYHCILFGITVCGSASNWPSLRLRGLLLVRGEIFSFQTSGYFAVGYSSNNFCNFLANPFLTSRRRSYCTLLLNIVPFVHRLGTGWCLRVRHRSPNDGHNFTGGSTMIYIFFDYSYYFFRYERLHLILLN